MSLAGSAHFLLFQLYIAHPINDSAPSPSNSRNHGSLRFRCSGMRRAQHGLRPQGGDPQRGRHRGGLEVRKLTAFCPSRGICCKRRERRCGRDALNRAGQETLHSGSVSSPLCASLRDPSHPGSSRIALSDHLHVMIALPPLSPSSYVT